PQPGLRRCSGINNAADAVATDQLKLPGLDPIGTWMVSSNPQEAHESAYHSACGRTERSSTCNPRSPQTGQVTGAPGLIRPFITAANAARSLLGGKLLPFISLIQCPSKATRA